MIKICFIKILEIARGLQQSEERSLGKAARTPSSEEPNCHSPSSPPPRQPENGSLATTAEGSGAGRLPKHHSERVSL